MSPVKMNFAFLSAAFNTMIKLQFVIFRPIFAVLLPITVHVYCTYSGYLEE